MFFFIIVKMNNGSNSQARLQRGHFTLKSSALAPTSTSYMGQDFIANHMKSHYRRILSAKAAVDTSPPKSMKMHMKVRDQKKRAALESRAGTPLSLTARSPSMEFLTSSYNETSAMNSVRGHRSPDSRLFSATSAWSPDQRPSTGKPIQRSQSVQSLNRHYPTATPSPSPRDILTTQAQSTPRSSRHPQLQAPTSPIARKPKQTLKTAHRLRQKKDLRTAPSLDNSEQGMTNNYLNENVRTLLGTYDEPDNLKVPMRAGYNTGEEGSQETDISHSLNYNTSSNIQHNAVPRLDLTQVSYSHRGRPSVRMNDSADFQANLWEEEQRYLKFISDVTTDILARGIFSNRVLQQVFEMHIERRKEHLDESRMREMIEQLKEDLSITDS